MLSLSIMQAHACRMHGHTQVVAMVTDGHQRPEIPPDSVCPSPAFPGMDKYVQLMQDCWKQVRCAAPHHATLPGSILQAPEALRAQALKAARALPRRE